MIVRYILLTLLPLTALFLQTTVFHQLTLFDCIPDIVLIMVVSYSLFNGSRLGGGYGLIFGLAEDIYCGRFIGLNALCKGTAGYLTGKFYSNVYRERVLIGVAGVVIATLINNFLKFLLFVIFSQPVNFYLDMLGQLFFQTLYNAGLTVPIYFWYYHSHNQGLLQRKTETD